MDNRIFRNHKVKHRLLIGFLLVLTILIAGFVVLEFHVNPVEASPDPDWLNGWDYRKSHVILNATGAGTNYQTMIKVHHGYGTDSGKNVYTNSKLQIDYDDIRFTDDDGSTLLDYWLEEKVDLQNFTKHAGNPIVPACSIQPSVIKEGTEYWMYYDDNTHIYRRIGTNETNFGSATQVLANGEYCFVWKDGSTYRMIYTKNSFDEIRLATSSNGTNFSYQGIVVPKGTGSDWDSVYVYDPCEIKVESTYYVYYAGRNTTSVAHSKIGLATSPNGTVGSYTKQGVVLQGSLDFEDAFLADPEVREYDTGKYILFYTGYSGSHRQTYATSTDLTSWNKHGFPIMWKTQSWEGTTTHNELCTIIESNKYKVWYRASTSPNYQIGYAYFSQHSTTKLPITDSYATVWIEVKDDLSSTNRTIYIYYGNSTVNSVSDDDATFLWADDCESGTATDKWEDATASPSYTSTSPVYQGSQALTKAIEGSNMDGLNPLADGHDRCATAYFYDQNNASDDSNKIFLGTSLNDAWHSLVGVTSTDWTKYCYYYSGGSWAASSISRSKGWHKVEFYFDGSGVDIHIDDTSVATDLDGNDFDTFRLYIHQSFVGHRRWDGLYIRKYVTPEPSHGTWGTEETSEFTASITINTPTHTWTINPGQSDIIINEDYINITVTASAAYTIQAKGNASLTNIAYGWTIGLGNVTMNSSGTAISLTTSYQNVPGLVNKPSGTDVEHLIYLWLSCPNGTRDGEYVYKLTIKVIEYTG